MRGHMVALDTDKCPVSAVIGFELIKSLVGAFPVPFQFFLKLIDEPFLRRCFRDLGVTP